MESKNVLIRGAERIDKINPLIIEAMDAIKPEDQIRIFYTGGLMEKEPKIYSDLDKFIGVAKNVHKNENGDYVCDCTINEFLVAARHFDNVIDNITVIVKPEEGEAAPVPKVEQLVVYDIDMKREFDKLQEELKDKDYKEGEVPFPRADDNPFNDEEFQQEIHDNLQEALKGETDGNSEVL